VGKKRNNINSSLFLHFRFWNCLVEFDHLPQGYQHLAGVEVEKGNKTFPLHLDILLCCFFPIPAVYVYSVVSEYSTRMSALSLLALTALIHRWLFLGALNRLLQINSARTLSLDLF